MEITIKVTADVYDQLETIQKTEISNTIIKALHELDYVDVQRVVVE
jgi:hypothetical protein